MSSPAKKNEVDIDLGNGESARVEVPSGWTDRSTLCFIAPERRERVGMLIKSHSVRASYSVSWCPTEERTTGELKDSHPAPRSVTRFTEKTISEESPAVLRRSYRYSDAIAGVLEQSQTLIADGERVITVTLTADPLSFAQRQAEIESSPRVLRAGGSAESADEEK